MEEENNLLKLCSENNINIYQLNDLIKESEEKQFVELININELIKFVNDNNIKNIFYHYVYIDEDFLIINEHTIRSCNIDDKSLKVLQKDFDKYNKKVSKLDFNKPIGLCIYCLYQGLILSVKQNDFWCEDEGFGDPELACEKIIENHLETIKQQKQEILKEIKRKREELKQQILDDEEFHLCTNLQLRRNYANRKIAKNKENYSLFAHHGGTWYDIPVNDFIELLWKEYSKTKNKPNLYVDL